MMHNRDDLFIKAILAMALSRAGRAETEVEVVPAGAQRIDVYSVPDPALAGELADMGLLGELGAEPAMFEPFSDTPGLREVRACFRKQLVWHHELERRARAAAGDAAGEDAEPPRPVPFPAIVILSPGRPETVLEAYRFETVRPGLYTVAPGFAVRIVVLSELPRTRETVLMRLGSEKLRADAIAEILRMPHDAWERKTAEPLLVKFDFGPSRAANPEEMMNIAEIQQQVEEARQMLRDEGRRIGERQGERQGERRLLLRMLRSQFGELPQPVVARIEAAEPDELEGWGERVLTAKSLAEVFGDS
jgi:Domain of unknown function (DUF4351)